MSDTKTTIPPTLVSNSSRIKFSSPSTPFPLSLYPHPPDSSFLPFFPTLKHYNHHSLNNTLKLQRLTIYLRPRSHCGEKRLHIIATNTTKKETIPPTLRIHLPNAAKPTRYRYHQTKRSQEVRREPHILTGRKYNLPLFPYTVLGLGYRRRPSRTMGDG